MSQAGERAAPRQSLPIACVHLFALSGAACVIAAASPSVVVVHAVHARPAAPAPRPGGPPGRSRPGPRRRRRRRLARGTSGTLQKRAALSLLPWAQPVRCCAQLPFKLFLRLFPSLCLPLSRPLPSARLPRRNARARQRHQVGPHIAVPCTVRKREGVTKGGVVSCFSPCFCFRAFSAPRFLIRFVRSGTGGRRPLPCRVGLRAAAAPTQPGACLARQGGGGVGEEGGTEMAPEPRSLVGALHCNVDFHPQHRRRPGPPAPAPLSRLPSPALVTPVTLQPLTLALSFLSL